MTANAKPIDQARPSTGAFRLSSEYTWVFHISCQTIVKFKIEIAVDY